MKISSDFVNFVLTSTPCKIGKWINLRPVLFDLCSMRLVHNSWTRRYPLRMRVTISQAEKLYPVRIRVHESWRETHFPDCIIESCFIIARRNEKPTTAALSRISKPLTDGQGRVIKQATTPPPTV